MSLILTLRKQRKVDFCEFHSVLVYRASSSTDMDRCEILSPKEIKKWLIENHVEYGTLKNEIIIL